MVGKFRRGLLSGGRGYYHEGILSGASKMFGRNVAFVEFLYHMVKLCKLNDLKQKMTSNTLHISLRAKSKYKPMGLYSGGFIIERIFWSVI